MTVARGLLRARDGHLRAVVQVVLVIAVIGIVANPLVLLLDRTGAPLLERSLRNACMLAAVLAALALVARLDGRSLAEYGLSFRAGWIRRLGAGALGGALFMAFVILAGAWVGGSRIAFDPRTPLDAPLALAFAGQIARYAAGSVFEEAISRGFLFTVLGRAWGRLGLQARNAAVVIATALVFGLLHLGNPDMTALGTANLVLAGVLFGLIYLRTGDLHAPIGAHAAWNIVQNNVFGLPNGGQPSEAALLAVSGSRFETLTGGAVGPEGGLVLTAALVATIAAPSRSALAIGRVGGRAAEHRAAGERRPEAVPRDPHEGDDIDQ